MQKYLFLILVIITLLLGLLSKKILDADEILINSLAEQLTNEQLNEFLSFQKKWQWVGYVIIPLLLLLKICIIAAIIDIGCFFFNKDIKYKKLFNIVTQAEFIFLGVIVCKTLWFYVFQQEYTLVDLQYFYPLSALNIIGYEGLQTWFIYPLQVLNVFEILYWFLLAYLIGKALKITTSKGFTIVVSSYGTGLVIWVIAVMFLTLNMS